MTQPRTRGRSVAVSFMFAALVSVAAQAPFAALSVIPHGRQILDITTGITVLPDGGSVIDQQTGVTLEAQHIRYLDGSFIEATGVNVSGTFGDLIADSLRISIPEGELSAEGELSLTRSELVVTAELMRFHAVDNVVVFDGSVVSSAPVFFADRVLLDATSGDVLLLGRYSFDGGIIQLNSPEEGGRLELRLRMDGDNVTYDAATEVSLELLERFKAHL